METLQQMHERHDREVAELRRTCKHYNVEVSDRITGFRRREIHIRCMDCGTPLVGWCSEGDRGRVQYAFGFKRIEENKA